MQPILLKSAAPMDDDTWRTVLMDLITNIFIGIGLAMDCAAVSLAGGASIQKGSGPKTIDAAVLAGLFFGFFQGAMMLLGGLGGQALRASVSGIGDWIAFILLAAVGLRMIYESFRGPEHKRTDLLDIRVLTLLAIATSIDALVVGTGIGFAGGIVWTGAAIVAIVTAVMTFVSVEAGKRIGHLIDNRIEIFGGLILLAIAANILLGHYGIVV